MPRNPKYDVLFEPINVGPKILKNRFYQVPHCGPTAERPGTQEHFRAMKAEGGWGAVCTEACSIHPESDSWPQMLAKLWDDQDIRNLAPVCDAIHQHGALAGVELWYGGVHSPCLETRDVTRAPTQIAHDFEPWVTPRAMDRDDIMEVEGYHEAAARRAVLAGFDIVYVYGSHSQGPMQFLSEHFNRRTDDYGGSFENRARFWLECLERVRDAVNGQCAVATRISVDDLGFAGISVDDACRFVELADDLVDLWDINISSVDWTADLGSSRFYRENWQAEWTARIKPHTTKPVVGVGRFTNPDTMVEVIKKGQLDIIGAARPSIADPFLPRKIEEGRLDEIRECIGCNICVSRWAMGGAPLICTQNATAGEEYRRGWHPERFTPAINKDKGVLIVGSGAAGLECAVVLGKRGMDRVHLVEARADIGGYVGWVSASLPRLGDWSRVVAYRKIQLDKLSNCEVIPRTRLDVETILNYGAELVVLATGAVWAGDGLNGISHQPIAGANSTLPHVATPEQVILDGKTVGETVLVYDCENYFMGSSLAEKFAADGKRTLYVTPLAHPSHYTSFTGEAPQVRAALQERNVEIHTDTTLDLIEDGQATIKHIDNPSAVSVDVETVVLVTQRVSQDGLYRELVSDRDLLTDNGIEGVYRIGDCLAPRVIADCVFDGHRLAREIDTDDPAKPLPFIREMRLRGDASEEDYEQQLPRQRDNLVATGRMN
jgi:dimethylamine/trimethylamine dehydrogenase